MHPPNTGPRSLRSEFCGLAFYMPALMLAATVIFLIALWVLF